MTQLNSSLLFMAQPAQIVPKPKLPESSQYWLPEQGSTIAPTIDALFYFILWVSAISVMGIFIAMFYFAWKYRATSREANESALSQMDHSNSLELTWSLIPLVFSIIFFVWGFKDLVLLRTAPKNSIEIYATGQKWQWTFKYPNGHVDSEMHVPKDKNVRVLMKSVDVLHALFIPEFRVKMDVVPGRYTDIWFNATRSGEFPIFCAEYCGTAHSDMLTKVVVHEGGGYEKWLIQKGIEIEEKPLLELGELTFRQFGCGACHSTDGSKNIGPSFQGIWGKTETMQSGKSITIDENYIRESILEPQKEIVQGYPATMPPFKGQLSDKRIDGLIEYIKSFK